jgi:hypothetical protein
MEERGIRLRRMGVLSKGVENLCKSRVTEGCEARNAYF